MFYEKQLRDWGAATGRCTAAQPLPAPVTSLPAPTGIILTPVRAQKYPPITLRAFDASLFLLQHVSARCSIDTVGSKLLQIHGSFIDILLAVFSIPNIERAIIFKLLLSLVLGYYVSTTQSRWR